MQRRYSPLTVAVLAFALVTTSLLAATATSTDDAAHPGSLGETIYTPTDHRLPDGGPLLDRCIPHPQIEITEEEGPGGFILGHDPVTDEPIYRPGSGVVDGAGTAEDPYVIEDWCIPPEVALPGGGDLSVPTVTKVGIRITDTSAHVVIRENLLQGQDADLLGEEQQIGIQLENADNVEIRDNTILGHAETGVDILKTNQATLIGNTLEGNGEEAVLIDIVGVATLEGNTITGSDEQGIRVYITQETSLRNNTITDNGHDALELGDAGQVTLVNNTVEDNRGGGIDIDYSTSQATVRNNTVTGNDRGIEVDVTGQAILGGNEVTTNRDDGIEVDAIDATVTETTVIGNEGIGLELDVDSVVVANTTVTDNDEDGVDANLDEEGALENNTIASNGNVGIDLVADGPVTVADNNIHGNDDNDNEGGLQVSGGPPVDATHNWWGDATGPRGTIEDACTDVEADGAGELITVELGGEVCFDPWLEGPVESAGAS